MRTLVHAAQYPPITSLLQPFKTLKTDTQGKSAEELDLPLAIVETDEGETVDWVRLVRCGEVSTVGGHIMLSSGCGELGEEGEVGTVGCIDSLVCVHCEPYVCLFSFSSLHLLISLALFASRWYHEDCARLLH